MLNSYLPILGYEKEGDFLGQRLEYSTRPDTVYKMHFTLNSGRAPNYKLGSGQGCYAS